ncbi:MAG: serine hydrolase, partial [Bryobacteraceae bacterium]
SEEPSLAHGAFGAMGGLVTTARDLARYVAFQLSAFPPRDEAERPPVRRSSVREMQFAWRSSGFSSNRGVADGLLQITARAYGYGLGISQDCRFSHIVGHGGGLPGFGSYMMWLPEYGAGMFAMANVTYAGPSGPISEAFDLLHKTGALARRELPPSPALTSTRDAIARLWKNWNGRDFADIAAGNLFLDIPAETRRKEIERIQAELGPCSSSSDVRALNLLRGSFRLNCERGFADVTFTLAPTMPPAVQHLSFATTKPLDRAMKTAASEIAAQFGSASAERLTPLAASSLDLAALGRRIDAARPVYGACRAGEPVSGDGVTSARVRLSCDLGQLDINLRAESGKLTAVTLAAAPGTYCAP